MLPASRHMLVIVNADDLGISPQVNDAIFELMSARRVTSATLMANAPALCAAAGCLGRFPHCSFGAHLNLTEFEPLTASPAAKPLLNAEGRLSRHIEQARPTPALLAAAYGELCAQVEHLAASGVRISHFDSHHHVHTTPYLFPVLKAVQKRYRVRKLRISKNLYAADQPCGPALARKKRLYNWALRNLYTTRTTEAFTEFLSFWKEARSRVLPYRSIELMVHPGASYAGDETALLRSDWLPGLPFSAELINYDQLA